jgi:hypothetical protein
MKKLSLMFLFASLFFIVSCATTLTSIPNDYTIKQNVESIIIGQMLFPESETILVGSTFTHVDAGDISVKNIKTGIEYTISPTENNKKYYFFVTLPQGDYTITEISWGDVKGHPRGSFSVNENNKTIYIGTIEITKIEQSTGQKVASWLLGNMSGARSVPMKYSIADKYDEVTAYFKEKYPNIKGEIEKSLLVIR